MDIKIRQSEPSMNKAIYLDIGNSNTKWKSNNQYSQVKTTEFSFSILPDAKKIWVSNVSQKVKDINQENIFYVKSFEKYKSLINGYQVPNSLGVDRWLAMIASYEQNPHKGLLIIDIGSAVTIDIVLRSGIHLGGEIFPGLDKIRKTFPNFPVVDCSNNNELGKNTHEAWSLGTYRMLVNAINQRVDHLSQAIPEVKILVTGGGYHLLQPLLNFPHKYYENLVLDGLAYYAKYMG